MTASLILVGTTQVPTEASNVMPSFCVESRAFAPASKRHLNGHWNALNLDGQLQAALSHPIGVFIAAHGARVKLPYPLW